MGPYCLNCILGACWGETAYTMKKVRVDHLVDADGKYEHSLQYVIQIFPHLLPYPTPSFGTAFLPIPEGVPESFLLHCRLQISWPIQAWKCWGPFQKTKAAKPCDTCYGIQHSRFSCEQQSKNDKNRPGSLSIASTKKMRG